MLLNMITGSYFPVAVSTQGFIRLHGMVLDNKISFMLSQAAGWERLAEICLKASNKKVWKIWTIITPLHGEDSQTWNHIT